MRKTNQLGIDLIKKYESFRPDPYYCPANYLTIGYGHLIKKGEVFNPPITEEKAEELLRKDLEIAEIGVLRNINVPLNDNQFAALVSFVFNLGAGALQSSTLRRKLHRGDYEAVPAEFRKWVYAGGRKLKGLIKRRNDEANLFISEIEEDMRILQD